MTNNHTGAEVDGLDGVNLLKLDQPLQFGSPSFVHDYSVRYPYVAGGMVWGISSKDLVVRMAKARLLSFFGTGALTFEEIEDNIKKIQNELVNGEPYGMNIVSNIVHPHVEEKTVDLFIKYGIRNIEAAAYMQMTRPLVKYRLNGLSRDADGTVVAQNKVIGKVSRPEIAEHFMSPCPWRLVEDLLKDGSVTEEQAELSKYIPVADDVCMEADSGGQTDMGVMLALLPYVMQLRDELFDRYSYKNKVRVGVAGGIGTPEAVLAAFMLGADFIVTGSINQCTVEAGTSDAAKDLLQEIDVQDTDYAPSTGPGLFEMGAKMQVVKKGVFITSRANRLHDVYKMYNSFDEVDDETRSIIEEKYLKARFHEIYESEIKAKKLPGADEEIAQAEEDPKHKMALVFRWYMERAMMSALEGNEAEKVNYLVPCGPALGAFNRWVKGTELEDWRRRHVDEIAERLMSHADLLLRQRIKLILQS